MRQRRKAREIALQVLYGLDFLKISSEEALDLFRGSFETPRGSEEFASLLIHGAWNNRQQIDSLIGGCSENWSVARMSRVDRSILRMAVYELLHCQDIPPKVTINEAIDLGKVYGSENSGSFINGILDALYAELRKKDADQDRNTVAKHP